jgi:hypothetical protein
MNAAKPMTTRGGHYTALLETMNARGATKLHDDERKVLLAAADALLFGEEEQDGALASALETLDRLQESDRWSSEACAELRVHLLGCGERDPSNR